MLCKAPLCWMVQEVQVSLSAKGGFESHQGSLCFDVSLLFEKNILKAGRFGLCGQKLHFAWTEYTHRRKETLLETHMIQAKERGQRDYVQICVPLAFTMPQRVGRGHPQTASQPSFQVWHEQNRSIWVGCISPCCPQEQFRCAIRVSGYTAACISIFPVEVTALQVSRKTKWQLE